MTPKKRIPSIFLGILTLFVCVAPLWAQTTVKVSAAIGEVTFQKVGKAEWAPLKVGAKLKQSDKIRTAVESQATLLFDNGSQLTVAENSVIEISTLNATADVSQTKLGIKTGKLMFNIQKIANGRSSFEFQAQTATAAIRGTEGEILVKGSRSVASLLTGRLEMLSKQGKGTIVAGQIIFQTSKGFIILPKPQDKKGYEELVRKYLADTTEVTDTAITNIAATVDSTIKPVEDSVKTDTTESKPDTTANTSTTDLSCSIDAYPSEIPDSRIRITGKATDGAQIISGALRTSVAGGNWKMDLAWDISQQGAKSYPISLVSGDKTISCGVVQFTFVPKIVPLALKLYTPSPIKVCNGPVQIAGSYTGSNARLVAKYAGNSIDLSSATGNFTRSIPINTFKRLMNLDEVEMVLSLSNSEGEISQSIPMRLERTCKDLNSEVPLVSIAYSPNTCVATLSVSGTFGDELKVSMIADDYSEVYGSTITSDLRGMRVTLLPGIHSYTINATDLAGNIGKQSLLKASCWPDVRFEIKVEGANRELIRIPPGPPGQLDAVAKQMRFSISGLFNDDFRALDRVTVRNNGRIVKEWRLTQITGTTFDIPVDLKRNQVNVILIEVADKNGRIRTAQKEFDFR